MNDFFSIATMHPVKRPIMCRSILGKTDNCSPLGNMLKRSCDGVKKMRMAERGTAIMHVFPSVSINVHVEKEDMRDDQPKRAEGAR